MRGHPPSPELPHFPGLHLIYHVLHSFPDALQCYVLLINFIFSRVPNLSSLFEVFFFFYHCGCFGCLPSPPAPVLWSDQSINPCAIRSQVLGFLVLTTFVPPLGAGFYHGIIKFGKALPGHWAQQLPQNCQAKGASVQATSSSSGLQIRLFLDKKICLPLSEWLQAGTGIISQASCSLHNLPHLGELLNELQQLLTCPWFLPLFSRALLGLGKNL